MLKFNKAIYLSLLFKFILSARLRNSLSGSDVLLFLEFVNIVFIFDATFIEFKILLYIYLVIISFASYKEYLIFLISFNKFSVVLPGFTCARVFFNFLFRI